MRNFVFLIFVIFFSCQSKTIDEKQTVDAVNPFIGAGGEKRVGFRLLPKNKTFTGKANNVSDRNFFVE